MAGDGVEIEHKYLLAAAPEPAVLAGFGPPARFEQRYLSEGPDGITRRVRSITEDGTTTYVYTEKELLVPRGTVETPAAVVNAERENAITAEEFAALCAEADPAAVPVVKDRWRVPAGDLVFELDHVLAPIDLWVLEVEVDDAARVVDVPAVFGPVTEDPTCSMAKIARGAYPPPS